VKSKEVVPLPVHITELHRVTLTYYKFLISALDGGSVVSFVLQILPVGGKANDTH
jgi:hypothetical protein